MGRDEEFRIKSKSLNLDGFPLTDKHGGKIVYTAQARKMVASERRNNARTGGTIPSSKQVPQRFTSKETVKGKKRRPAPEKKEGMSLKKKIIIGVLVIAGSIALGAGVKGCIDENSKPKASLKYALAHGNTTESLHIDEDIPAKLTQLEEMANIGGLTGEQLNKLLYGTGKTAISIAKSKLSGAINDYRKDGEPVTTSDITLKAYYDAEGGICVRVNDIGEFYEKGFIDFGGNKISNEIKDYIITIADIQGLQDQFKDGLVSGEKICEDCTIYLEDMSKFAAGELTFDGQQFSFDYRGINFDATSEERTSPDNTQMDEVTDSEYWER